MHLVIDQVDHSLTESGKLVLLIDGNGTGTPLFADFVEKRSYNSDQDINGPTVSGDGFFDKQLSRTIVIPSPCLE